MEETVEYKHVYGLQDTVDRMVLVERRKTFPLSWLDRLKYLRPFPITSEMVNQMVQDILRNGTNTLRREAY